MPHKFHLYLINKDSVYKYIASPYSTIYSQLIQYEILEKLVTYMPQAGFKPPGVESGWIIPLTSVSNKSKNKTNKHLGKNQSSLLYLISVHIGPVLGHKGILIIRPIKVCEKDVTII